MLNDLDDYDWKEAFGYAGEWTNSQGDCEPPSGVSGYTGSTEAFSREDVARIVASSDGEPDGRDWLGVFHLADGRFAVLRAGCDYTGWD